MIKRCDIVTLCWPESQLLMKNYCFHRPNYMTIQSYTYIETVGDWYMFSSCIGIKLPVKHTYPFKFSSVKYTHTMKWYRYHTPVVGNIGGISRLFLMLVLQKLKHICSTADVVLRRSFCSDFQTRYGLLSNNFCHKLTLCFAYWNGMNLECCCTSQN